MIRDNSMLSGIAERSLRAATAAFFVRPKCGCSISAKRGCRTTYHIHFSTLSIKSFVWCASVLPGCVPCYVDEMTVTELLIFRMCASEKIQERTRHSIRTSETVKGASERSLRTNEIVIEVSEMRITAC